MKKVIFYITSCIITMTGCSQTENSIKITGRNAFSLLEIQGEIKSVKEYTCSVEESSDVFKLNPILPIPIPVEWIFDSIGTIKNINHLNHENLNEIISHKFIKYDGNKEYWYEVQESDTILIKEIQLDDSLNMIHSVSYNYSGLITSKSDVRYTDKKIESTLINEYSKEKYKTVSYLNAYNRVDSIQVFLNEKLFTKIKNEYYNNELSKIISKYNNGIEKEIRYKYKYDDPGNWVERIMYEDNNLISITIREINYK